MVCCYGIFAMVIVNNLKNTQECQENVSLICSGSKLFHC